MILPVVAYGHPVLKKVAQDIPPDYPGLQEFIADMWETMYESDGVGLAAPQVNRSIRLFVIDSSPFIETHPELKPFKRLHQRKAIPRRGGGVVVQRRLPEFSGAAGRCHEKTGHPHQISR